MVVNVIIIVSLDVSFIVISVCMHTLTMTVASVTRAMTSQSPYYINVCFIHSSTYS